MPDFSWGREISCPQKGLSLLIPKARSLVGRDSSKEAAELLGHMHVPAMEVYKPRYTISESARLPPVSPESWAILEGLERWMLRPPLGTDP